MKWLLAAVCVCVGMARAQAAEKTAKLERLGPSPRLLKAPEGLAGDFTVAREAPTLDFAVFPNQWAGARLWSAWGDSLCAPDGNFYASIGDHATPHGTSYVYRIDPRRGTVDLIVDYNAIVGLKKPDYAPGKIHAPICDGGDGWLYFVGYEGSIRGTTEKDKFSGNWLLRYELKSGRVENLGILVPNAGIPEMVAFPARKRLYGLASPGKAQPSPAGPLFAYDYGRRKLVFRGGPKCNMLRAIIVARDGRVFYESEGKLVCYDPDTNRVTPTDATVPGSGRLREASAPAPSGLVYCFSSDGVIFTFDPKTLRIKTVTKAFVTAGLYTASCELSPKGRYLYYMPSAHGGSRRHGSALIQLDTTTGRRKVIAFLNETLRRQKNYNLGGTYGLALSADGGVLFMNCNGAPPDQKRPEFGLCAALVIRIPAGER